MTYTRGAPCRSDLERGRAGGVRRDDRDREPLPPGFIRGHFKRAVPTVCGWKGTASYYTIEVDGKQNSDAAWYYPEPKDAAKEIAGYVAFWKGVKVEG